MEKKRFNVCKSIAPEKIMKELKLHFEGEDVIEENMGNMTLFVIEKYYMRNNSYASCTICMKQEETETEFIVISSGAGVGILNLSWGAAGNLAEKVETMIKNL